MSVERISYTGAIPGIKIKATTLAELDASVGQVGQGEIGVVNGELFYKLERNSTSFKPTGGLEATGTIASAAVLTLNATPVELIAAPGAGKVVVVEEVQLFLDYGSADYVAAAGEDLDITYASGSEIMQIDSDNGFLTASADSHLIAKTTVYDADAATTANGLIYGGNANKAVNLTILVGEVATGDSDLKYKVKYRIVDLLT
jgi:hypothetical protein